MRIESKQGENKEHGVPPVEHEALMKTWQVMKDRWPKLADANVASTYLEGHDFVVRDIALADLIETFGDRGLMSRSAKHGVNVGAIFMYLAVREQYQNSKTRLPRVSIEIHRAVHDELYKHVRPTKAFLDLPETLLGSLFESDNQLQLLLSLDQFASFARPGDADFKAGVKFGASLIYLGLRTQLQVEATGRKTTDPNLDWKAYVTEVFRRMIGLPGRKLPMLY